MENIQEYKGVIDKIDNMTDLLYQQNQDKGIGLLNAIIQELTVVLNDGSFELDQKKILGAVQLAFQALEQKDSVLIADIFHYEIRPEIVKCIGER